MDSKLKKIHIFIVTSPIGITNGEQIIEEYLSFNDTTILIKDTLYTQLDTKKWTEVINIDKFIGYSRFHTILNKKKVVKLIESRFTGYGHYSFYVMDYDPITNYLANFFKGIKEINIIEDGIGNYYSSDDHLGGAWKKYIKWMFYNALGLKNIIYSGSCTGIERKEINKQYLHYPLIAPFSQKTLSLSTKIIDYIPFEDVNIILGQNTLVSNAKEYREILTELIEIVRNQKSVIFYKPHRFEKWDITSIVEKYDLKLIEITNPIESLITELKPQNIYSFGSSALLNISNSLSDNTKNKVKSFAYPYIDAKVYEPIIPLLKNSGVVVLERHIR